MKNQLIIPLFLLALFFSGCSTVKVIPEQVANGTINTADNSQTVNKDGVEITVSLSATDINAYNLESTVTAFNVSIRNSTTGELSYSEDSFVLIDDQGLQYTLLTPEKVREIIKKDSYYLMPYPYVGFYYLEDFQKTSFYNRSTSSLPYFYEVNPQDIFTKFLPLTTIIPNMKVEGLVYFKIDVATRKQIKLYVYRKGALKSGTPDFVLPFKIVQ